MQVLCQKRLIYTRRLELEERGRKLRGQDMTKRQNKCGNIKSKKEAQIQKEKQKGIDKDKIGVERWSFGTAGVGLTAEWTYLWVPRVLLR